MKIGLLGYGTVGRSVARLLRERVPGMELKTILRRPGKADELGMTDNFDDIVNDPEIDCIVEVMSGTEPALTHIRRALEAGKDVVTANKAALATDFTKLLELARKNDARLLFEASCGGGIPWIEGIKKAARLDRITEVSGILNGTSNYILDQMESDALSFDEALKEAQRLGFAEADPTADIGGFDVRNKALISTSLAFRLQNIVTDFPVIGIEKLTHGLLQDFSERGLALRLMMIAKRADTRYAVGVVPVLVSASSLEHAVKLNFNCARLTGDIVGPLLFYGQGAGGMPTADAVIQDLLSIERGTFEDTRLDTALDYDPSLLTGTGYFGDGHTSNNTLNGLVEEARRLNTFLAFAPANPE